MNKIFKLTGVLALGMAAMLPAVLTSCGKEEYDTRQYKGGVSLNVWGPRPVARGGELRFLGSGLDQVTSITLPGSGDVTDIKVVSDEEIRITVPQDAEEGKVVLHHAGGDITSLTVLSFLEPISLDEMTPMVVKPGSTLTLKGDYLNLISEVILPEEVAVGEDDFTAHSRKEISFIVPETAKSGKVIISDGGAPIPNWIYSDEEITIVLPSVEEVADLTNVKPGETITVTVKDIDLVKSVEMPDGQEVDFVTEDDKLKFVLPDNVSDGTIVMIPASGVKVAVATIGVALPEEVVADPASDIWKDDVIKFKGVNMELVTGVSFPNVAEVVAPESKSATEITVKVPEGTQSGKAVLHTASGGAVEVEISTLKPDAVSYSADPASLASEITISGKNLQNVSSVTFGGTATVAVVNPAANEIKVTVPATLPEGANSVVFTLTNGESVEAPAINLSAPVCAYATELPGDDAEINAGSTVTFLIANADRLAGVKVNGQNVQYILNGATLIVQIPSTAGKDTVVTLVSDNGEISYNISVIPATHQERVVYGGPMINLDWGGDEGVNKLRLYKESLEEVPAGATLVFHVTPAAEAQIQVNDANWGEIVTLRPGVGDATVGLELTAAIRSRIMDTNDGWSNTGLIIQGQNCVLSKITGEWEVSMETVFWEGSADLTGWGGMAELAWNDDAIANIFSTWKPGQVMRAYYTQTGGSEPKLKFGRGEDWAALPGSVSEFQDCSLPQGYVQHVLTADDIDQLVNHHGLLIQGQDIILTKLTIE